MQSTIGMIIVEALMELSLIKEEIVSESAQSICVSFVSLDLDIPIDE